MSGRGAWSDGRWSSIHEVLQSGGVSSSEALQLVREADALHAVGMPHAANLVLGAARAVSRMECRLRSQYAERLNKRHIPAMIRGGKR